MRPITGCTLTAASATNAHPPQTEKCQVEAKSETLASDGRADDLPPMTPPQA